SPELLFQILALAFDADEPRVADGQFERRGLQIAVLAVEVVAGRGVADEGAVQRRGSREHLARRKIRPVARTDQAAGFHPVESAVEMRGERRARSALHRERFRPGQVAAGRHLARTVTSFTAARTARATRM